MEPKKVIFSAATWIFITFSLASVAYYAGVKITTLEMKIQAEQKELKTEKELKNDL